MKTSPRESRVARMKRLLPEANAVYSAVKAAYKQYKGGSKTKRRRMNPLDSVITNQYDVAGRYKYKRMPKYKRKKWVAVLKRSQFIDQKSQPLLSHTISYGVNVTWANDLQRSFGFSIYPIQMGVTGQERDLLDIFIREFGGTTVADQAGRKLFFKSAVLDVQMRNTGSVSHIIDVYRIRLKMNWPTSRTIEGQFLDSFADQSVTGVGANDPAVTPFQNPSFCRIWKVLSKKEILLSAGQTTTMQIRDPRNRQITGRQLQSEVTGIPYVTYGYLFQARGVPGLTSVGPPALYGPVAGEVTVSIQKTYNYALVPGNANRDAIVNV